MSAGGQNSRKSIAYTLRGAFSLPPSLPPPDARPTYLLQQTLTHVNPPPSLPSLSPFLPQTRDLSAVKSYLLRQLAKIQAGRVRLQDFVFAKEVKLGTYK